MRKTIFLLATIFISSCGGTRINMKERDYSEGIVYVLPGTVQKLLVKKQQLENTYYVIEKINGLQFRIFQDTYETETNWLKNTNRYISVSGKLYPLLIGYDSYFANTETAKTFLEDYKQGIYRRTRATIIRDHVYHVDFNINGKIIYEGNALNN